MSNTPGDREQRMVEGVALIAAGTSIPKAAASVGIPQTTLYDQYQRRLGPKASENRKKALEAQDQELTATAYGIASEGLRNMLEQLPSLEPGDTRGHTLVASKVLERLRGNWGQRQSSGNDALASALGNTLDLIAQGKAEGLSIDVRPVGRTIDVDATD